MRRGTRLLAVGAAAAALVSAAGACSSPSAAPPARPTTTAAPTARSIFVDRANEICRDMKARGAALTGTVPTDEAQLAPLFDEMADVVDDAVGRIRALTPPPGDEATIATATADLAAAGAAARRVAAAGGQGELALAYQQQQAAQTASDAQMRAYGLTDCVLGN